MRAACQLPFLFGSQTPTSDVDLLWQGGISAGFLEQVYSWRDVGLLNSFTQQQELVFSLVVHGQVKQFSVLSWHKQLLLCAAAC